MTPINAMMEGLEWVEIEGDPPKDDDGIPYATHKGTLKIGDIELQCYQLSDGQRVFDADSVMRFFGWTPNPLHVDKEGNG